MCRYRYISKVSDTDTVSNTKGLGAAKHCTIIGQGDITENVSVKFFESDPIIFSRYLCHHLCQASQSNGIHKVGNTVILSQAKLAPPPLRLHTSWHGYTFTLGVSFEVKKGPNFESLTCDTPPVSQLPLPEPTNLRLVRYVTHAATEACKKTKTNNIG